VHTQGSPSNIMSLLELSGCTLHFHLRDPPHRSTNKHTVNTMRRPADAANQPSPDVPCQLLLGRDPCRDTGPSAAAAGGCTCPSALVSQLVSHKANWRSANRLPSLLPPKSHTQPKDTLPVSTHNTLSCVLKDTTTLPLRHPSPYSCSLQSPLSLCRCCPS
jgi:hypothetical protein